MQTHLCIPNQMGRKRAPPCHICGRHPATYLPCCFSVACAVAVGMVQEAGATPALELAFTLADGLEYIR